MPNNSSTLSSPPRKPPVWLNRSAYWFRIGLILFSVITLLLGTTACTSNSSAKTILSSWQPATKLTPRETLVQIVQSHSNLTELQSAIDQMKVWQVKGREGVLNIYDFHQPNICGQIGCLYVGYFIPFAQTQVSKEVFAAYLNPNLPPEIPLFQAEAESTYNGMPCLVATQQSSNNQTQLKFCYERLTYQLVEKRNRAVESKE
ncbi:hypothetical protein NIES2119_24125 [[Phormidium ambiguum] IAM M-71]|uniref:Uncharacterized protein n=1 Tax=[Phormidium ambiguum] IAM M-71 TaxID=454136 RepID=A0A1U7I9G0_9CYAN|nr:hypothetical protein [Phormidium ambiguum]OKH33151.1 hypothetical protein NIES2119_24125 [Phormidium ambiguum IAM M-71]